MIASQTIAPEPAETVSAIVATVDRTEPLGRLLHSLADQDHRLREVIIVDQNLQPLPGSLLYERKWPFPLRHIHCPVRRGVSYARNVGWRQAEGRWLLFPDDDCWYPAGYLAQAIATVRGGQTDILTGRAATPTGRTINGRFETSAGWISFRSVLTSQIEWNMLVRRDAMAQLCGYDESISLGGSTPWQGGEGYDLLFRAIELDMRCRYDPTLVAHHDELPVSDPDVHMQRKGRDYARGLGRILALHGFGLLGVAYWVARSLANLSLSLLAARRNRACYYLHQAVGRAEGFFGRNFPLPSYPRPQLTSGGQAALPAEAGEAVRQ